MALHDTRIKKVKIGETDYFIVPDQLQSNGYALDVPALTADTVIATTADLGNYVTLDTAQTVTGTKTFGTDIYLGAGSTKARVGANNDGDLLLKGPGGSIWFYNAIKAANNVDIGAASYKFKDLYLSNSVKLYGSSSNYWEVYSDNTYDQIRFGYNGTRYYTLSTSAFNPSSSNTRDLGTSNYAWKNLYLSGVLSGGNASVSVPNIATLNTQQTFTATKTWSTNGGESTTSISGGYVALFNNDQSAKGYVELYSNTGDGTYIEVGDANDNRMRVLPHHIEATGAAGSTIIYPSSINLNDTNNNGTSISSGNFGLSKSASGDVSYYLSLDAQYGFELEVDGPNYAIYNYTFPTRSGTLGLEIEILDLTSL